MSTSRRGRRYRCTFRPGIAGRLRNRVGRMRAGFLTVALLLAIGGCQQQSAETDAGGAAAAVAYEATPELIAAATSEGEVTYYSSLEVLVAERLARAFEERYPGIKVRVERAGSERVFQRIGQEYSTGIHNADVVDTSDAVHFTYMKERGWLTPAAPSELSAFPVEMKDPD